MSQIGSSGVSEADLAIAHRLKELVLKIDGQDVQKIILFGSRARGDARADSDFDILVVLRGVTPEQRASYRLSLYEAFGGTGVHVEAWVMEEEEFEETKAVIGGLAYPAHREGVVLYENA